jgi:hypothetical protein
MGDDQQVPAIVENVASVAGNMPVAAILGRQQVARPRIMAALQEGISDHAGKLAGDQYLHRRSFPGETSRREHSASTAWNKK